MVWCLYKLHNPYFMCLKLLYILYILYISYFYIYRYPYTCRPLTRVGLTIDFEFVSDQSFQPVFEIGHSNQAHSWAAASAAARSLTCAAWWLAIRVLRFEWSFWVMVSTDRFEWLVRMAGSKGWFEWPTRVVLSNIGKKKQFPKSQNPTNKKV